MNVRIKCRVSQVSIALIIGLSLGACAYNTGTALTDEQIHQFVPGKSTVADVIAKLGDPSQNVSNADGSTTLSYTSTHTDLDGKGAIPIVGPLLAKNKSELKTTIYEFDRRGVLKDLKTMVSHQG